MTKPPSFDRQAPAKLNLTLAVIRRLPDGYHALHSVMVPLTLTDAISVTPLGPRTAKTAESDVLTVTGYDPGPTRDNLVLRAIDAARLTVGTSWPRAPEPPPFLSAHLTKRIPVAAGLGGGSSDAACAMDAALEAWDARLTATQAGAIAASLGSDVSFFLAGGTALVTGRGEDVAPLRDPTGEPPGFLLVTPRLPISTQAVYDALDRGTRPPVAGASRMASEHFAADLQRGIGPRDLLDRAGVLAASNDLLPATISIAPTLLPFRRALARLLGHPIGQSGSGPTAWVMYASLVEAKHAAGLVKEAWRDGTLPPVGDGEPIVVATTLLTRETAARTAQGGT